MFQYSDRQLLSFYGKVNRSRRWAVIGRVNGCFQSGDLKRYGGRKEEVLAQKLGVLKFPSTKPRQWASGVFLLFFNIYCNRSKEKVSSVCAY